MYVWVMLEPIDRRYRLHQADKCQRLRRIWLRVQAFVGREDKAKAKAEVRYPEPCKAFHKAAINGPNAFWRQRRKISFLDVTPVIIL